MNTRERFLEIMDFNPNVHSLKYEFGYWGETVDNWYKSGLPKKKYPVVNKVITTPTSSLYSTAWTCVPRLQQDRSAERNSRNRGRSLLANTGFSSWTMMCANISIWILHSGLIDVNMHFSPMFDIKIIREDDKVFEYVDIDGVRQNISQG